MYTSREETQEGIGSQQKRILLISYYFPPIGGPHSIRWVSLVNKLIEAGFALDVLTINPAGGYASLDPSLLDSLPQTIAIHRVFPGPLHRFRHDETAARYFSPAREVQRTQWPQRVLRKLRQMGRDALTALLIPDAMVEWTPWALRKGQALLARNRFDLLLSSAHPACDHIVGYFLKRRSRIPWICFYSDPWSFYAGREISQLRSLVEKRLEARLLRLADHILVPTEEAKTGFLEAFPFLSPHRISLVPAGADLSEYAVSPPQQKRPNHFKLVYTGTFYDRIREPFAFYEALDYVSDLDVEVVMAGHILPQHRDTRAKSRVTYWDYQQRRQCIALQKSADVLLFFGNVSTTQLPSKLFEYFAAARPILSIDPLLHTRASQLIQTSRRGLCVPNKPEAIAAAIRELHAAWKEDRLQDTFDTSPRPELSWETGSQTLIQTIQAMLA